MCGIFFAKGYVNLPKSVIDTVQHRGPDGSGWEEFTSDAGKVVLAHRRLAIVDLSDAGKQPMQANDRYWLTYNGELYNYLEIKLELEALGVTFKTKTDSEVILQSYITWGENCLSKFNGMFAFVIWDDKKKEFFAARDRFGVKPLFYYQEENKIVFSSEIKQICAMPEFKRKINKEHLLYLIKNQHHPINNSTLFMGVLQIEPGTYMLSQSDKYEIRRWYYLGSKDTNTDYKNEFSLIFKDSVKKRLIADASVGALLSGGLDSSAIVCMVHQLMQQDGNKQLIETFTSFADDPMVDEREYSNAVVNKTNFLNHLAKINDDSLQLDIEKIIYHQEEPFFSTSIQSEWNIYKNIADKTNLKVVLDGQGSDELSCGYLFMIQQVLADYIKRGKYFVALKEFILTCYKHKTLSPKTILLDTLCKTHPRLIKFLQNIRKKDLENIEKESFSDFSQYTQYAIRRFIEPQLRWQDRSSMAFSIESRQPFLDYRLVELLLSVPVSQKFRNGETKYILRQALRDILPEKVYNRRSKFGFPSPQRKLVENIDKDYWSLNYEYGNNLLKNLDYSNININTQQQFFIFTLGLWARIFQVEI